MELHFETRECCKILSDFVKNEFVFMRMDKYDLICSKLQLAIKEKYICRLRTYVFMYDGKVHRNRNSRTVFINE